MSTTYTQQSVAFVYPNGIDPSGVITADTGVQTYFSYDINSSGTHTDYNYATFAAGVYTKYNVRIFSFTVTAANAANIVADQPGLKTRMAGSFPTMTNIYTWGIQIAWE